MNKIETELVYLDTRIPPAALGYGTSLPGSPVDGQEYVLVDSLTNPSYQWRFRYNAGSSSAYKWECVGGTEVSSTIGSSENLTSTGTWSDLATLGPDFTLPRAGDYLISAVVDSYHSVNPAQVSITVTQAGGGGIGFGGGIAAVINQNSTGILKRRQLGAASGLLLRVRYLNNTAGTATFRDRWLYVMPIRVS
jgi:hypothetical protein